MNNISEYIPFLIPLLIAQIGLALFALIHVLRHPHYRFGNRIVWVFIVLLIQFIGPAIYFAFGRGDR